MPIIALLMGGGVLLTYSNCSVPYSNELVASQLEDFMVVQTNLQGLGFKV